MSILSQPFNNLNASATVAQNQANPAPTTGGQVNLPLAPPSAPASAGGTSGTSGATHTVMTQGWYITIGIVVAMILGNVPVLGPILFGVLGLALLYQISQLVQGQ